MWYPVAFSYTCQGVRDAKVFYVFMDMAYKLVGALSPFNVYRLVTRNSTMTLEDMITFFCPQFPAILCLSTTPALQINCPSAPYRLTRRSLLSLPGSYLLDNVSCFLCDLSNLPHSVGNENFPRFLEITDPVQGHHSVHPHVHRSNGPPL